METQDTVRIEAKDPEQGFYVVINASDFDKKTMKIYDGPENPVPETSNPLSMEAMQAQIADLQAQLAAAATVNSGADAWGEPKPPVA